LLGRQIRHPDAMACPSGSGLIRMAAADGRRLHSPAGPRKHAPLALET
jgi:hypothetical protein